jgi:hypothetical protein
MPHCSVYLDGVHHFSMILGLCYQNHSCLLSEDVSTKNSLQPPHALNIHIQNMEM